jgi:hypothetical protein
MEKLSERLPRDFMLKFPDVYARLWALELEVEILTKKFHESQKSQDELVSAEIAYLDQDK